MVSLSTGLEEHSWGRYAARMIHELVSLRDHKWHAASCATLRMDISGLGLPDPNQDQFAQSLYCPMALIVLVYENT